MSMSRVPVRLACGLLLAILAFLSGACDNDSDPTAPADSVITVSANPQTIVVPSVGNGEADVTATVRSKNGTRLPDQEITFSTSQGSLDPLAETPIQTDDQGQAISRLFTRTSATITARSGSITGTTQVQTVTCDLAQFLLSVQPMVIDNCDDTLMLTATIEDVDGDPCENIRVIFSQDPNDMLTGTFSPSSQVSSDAAGLAIATWRANQSQCDSKCTAVRDPNGTGDCGSLYFTAGDITGTFNSAPVPVLEDVD